MFMAERALITDYITAYCRRYDECNNPFTRLVRDKLKTNPKGVFKEILGPYHKFKEKEIQWIDFVDRSILYTPKEGDRVCCSYFDDDLERLVDWECTFKEGNKETFTDTDGNIQNKHSFIYKLKN